jgi:hypothetical protein
LEESSNNLIRYYPGISLAELRETEKPQLLYRPRLKVQNS